MPVKVSVIIPIKNENNFIGECLKRIFSQTYPKDKLEILVVDGMSIDGTREIVVRESETEVRKSGTNVRLIDNPKGYRAPALNIGIREARGDVIIRVDARTIISPDYIEKCVETLDKTGADNVGGVQKPIMNSESEVGKSRLKTQLAVSIGLTNPFGVGNAQFRLGKKSGFVDTVYLGCFRREIFDKVGFFDEESAVISEDSDMNYRIRKAGGKVYLNKDIIAYYFPRDNFRDLWKLFFRYGGAKAGNLLRRGKLTAWRQFVPPTFLFLLIFLLAAGIFEKKYFYYLFFCISSYIIVNLLISFCLAVEQKKAGIISVFWRLFFVFPAMHFAWATGFWKRLTQGKRAKEYWEY